MNKVSIIIPCYYNENNIPITLNTLFALENSFPIETNFEYILVDDGSKDNTFKVIKDFHLKYPSKVKGIKLSGNFGSYNAVIAGMEYATGDCNVIISADLQDPPELIQKMYDYWTKGIKLVIGSRENRDDSFISKQFSNLFHYLIKKFALKNIPDGGFDYVLFDKQIKEEILKIKENNSNVFYLMTWMGYDYVNIPYTRRKRDVGKSRWTLSKKIKLFIDSFVAFSFFPLRLITISGMCFGLISFFYGVYIIIAKFFGDITIEGWSALMVVLLFVSSFQMIAIGILGEYLWRSLDASRKRPLYIVENTFIN